MEKILKEYPVEIPIVILTEASKIKVLQSENIIHILIAYHRIKLICIRVTIFPVSHQYERLQLLDDTVTAQDTIARALRCNGAASCRTQPSPLKSVSQVDGIIFIYEGTARVSTNDGPEIIMNGTHLVTFRFSSIINGT